ncbi:hypothetical protein QJQ45_030303 [Haematococcus lacustris]|nr:hypothetical protein QJQ45_030303 [Haematococcus lacustris]
MDNLRHLADLVDSCTEPYLNFGLEGGRLITLDARQAHSQGPEVLAINAIASDRSDNLRSAAPGVTPEEKNEEKNEEMNVEMKS